MVWHAASLILAIPRVDAFGLSSYSYSAFGFEMWTDAGVCEWIDGAKGRLPAWLEAPRDIHGQRVSHSAGSLLELYSRTWYL